MHTAELITHIIIILSIIHLNVKVNLKNLLINET